MPAVCATSENRRVPARLERRITGKDTGFSHIAFRVQVRPEQKVARLKVRDFCPRGLAAPRLGVILFLVSLAALVGIVLVKNFDELTQFALTRKVFIKEEMRAELVWGWARVGRWRDTHRACVYFLSTGFKILENEFADGHIVCANFWNSDGTMRMQVGQPY